MSLPLSVNQAWGACRRRFRIQLIATKGLWDSTYIMGEVAAAEERLCKVAAATLHNAATGYNWKKD